MAATAACLASDALTQATSLAADLCKQFYGLGWVSGTGGSISLKVHDASTPLAQQLIIMAPSGVQKERMLPEDMYLLDADGNVLSAPSPKPAPHRPPKCSECAPLFMKAYKMRKAGAVIHSHGMESCLATMINPAAKEFRITHMEMIKGISGHGYHDELVVPIIENTPREYELTDSLAQAMGAYPKSTAVLVRNHGIYVWGDSWISAKTQAECYHYLFEAALRLHSLGLDPADPKHGPLTTLKASSCDSFSDGTVVENGTQEGVSQGFPRQQHPNPAVVVLDIEGTTTPISFVTEILFPYARDNVRNHLESTYDSQETQDDINLLRKQAEQDVTDGIPGVQLIPSTDTSKEKVVAAVETNVISMIKADRKVTALKELQGHIWRSGYMKGELQGQVFEDVPKALAQWQSAGSKVYIYSSGSREAQRLIFGNTQYGDLRPFLCGYFDTFIGNKREPKSYKEIFLSVGVDEPSQIVFATDVLQEAMAAKEAGLRAVLVVRPGNVPLPEDHGFPTVTNLLEI
ncbi:hypothetical protein GOP47_0018635 [Adiantum capillus-veneris]|uniref:Probable bifunctional methylthioribulose-1-phosphate dehydratase/enolase-phosphatase E1 n=1 Tax=Adiantum capillus-veneris TaxID=13818 RepID=A0A9D4ZAX1_ADICA|nr:hypothetical protein GOP47_0018635 [Adiantum capillus-veneris]